MSVEIVDQKIIIQVTTDEGVKKDMVLSDVSVKILIRLINDHESALADNFYKLKPEYYEACQDYEHHESLSTIVTKNENGSISVKSSGVTPDASEGAELSSIMCSLQDDLCDLADEFENFGELYTVCNYVLEHQVEDDQKLKFMDDLVCSALDGYCEQIRECVSNG